MTPPTQFTYETSKDFETITIIPDSDFYYQLDVHAADFIGWIVENDLAPGRAYTDHKNGIIAYIFLDKKMNTYTYPVLIGHLVFLDNNYPDNTAWTKHNLTDLIAMYAEDAEFEEVDHGETESDLINEAILARKEQ